VNAPEFVPAGNDNIPKTAERGEYKSLEMARLAGFAS
jgi:hypothetical protein